MEDGVAGIQTDVGLDGRFWSLEYTLICLGKRGHQLYVAVTETVCGGLTLTNFGRNLPSGKLPNISICTRTCPEHPFPAPIPIVGMRRFFVMISAIGVGTASNTIAKQPASWTARASSRSLAADSAVLPCTLNPPRLCCRCGVRPIWPSTEIPTELIRLIVGAISMPPSSLTACRRSKQLGQGDWNGRGAQTWARPSWIARIEDFIACSGEISYEPMGRSHT